MNKKTLTLILASVFGVMAAVGCDDTARGVEKDSAEAATETAKVAEKTGEAVVEGAEKAGEAVKEGAEAAAEATENAAAAAKLTPAIKAAILANPLLNEPENEVNVETTESEVRLEGKVKSAQLKNDAERIAKKIIEEQAGKQRVVNNLRVEG